MGALWLFMLLTACNGAPAPDKDVDDPIVDSDGRVDSDPVDPVESGEPRPPLSDSGVDEQQLASGPRIGFSNGGPPVVGERHRVRLTVGDPITAHTTGARTRVVLGLGTTQR